jgi:hypothetical protein
MRRRGRPFALRPRSAVQGKRLVCERLRQERQRFRVKRRQREDGFFHFKRIQFDTQQQRKDFYTASFDQHFIRKEIGLANPLNISAGSSEFLFNSLIAPIDVIDAIDHR